MLPRHGVILSVPTSILLSITAHHTITGNTSIAPFALSNNQLVQLRRWMSTSTHRCRKITSKMRLCKVKCPDSLGGQVSFVRQGLRKNRCLHVTPRPIIGILRIISMDAQTSAVLEYKFNTWIVMTFNQPKVHMVFIGSPIFRSVDTGNDRS